MDSRDRPQRWRRAVLGVLLALLVLPPLACRLALPHLAGAWDADPRPLSPAAETLLANCFEDIDPERLFDAHVHAVGIGAGGTGCSVNPRMRSWLHPLDRGRFEIYAHAAGITDLERADAQYIERLLAWIKGSGKPGKYALLAFAPFRDASGAVDPEHTEFHVPNDYVLELAEQHPQFFEPVASVHPHASDALDELERVAARGARMVKWIPSAMGIDPASDACDAFYAKMVELDMTLLTHGGEEKAVELGDLQRLGNPLRLRRALDAGVRVVVAHCASLGTDEDLDDPNRAAVRSFELFLRLMEEERYVGRLFGEISAVTQVNRYRDVLDVLIEREDLHDRLLNGSDWPLPAINVLFQTRALVRDGFLTPDERDALNEIYRANPLLFDFALKRTVHHPTTNRRFPATIFQRRPEGYSMTSGKGSLRSQFSAR